MQTDYQEQLDQLDEQGCTLIQLFDSNEVNTIHKGFVEYLNNVPEIKKTKQGLFDENRRNPKSRKVGKNPRYSFDPLGALGFTSSFHADFARNAREMAESKMGGFHSQVASNMQVGDEVYVQQLIDQFALRAYNTNINVALTDYTLPDELPPGDLIIPGWINLDREGCDQTFYYVPESHVKDATVADFKNVNKRSALVVKPGYMVLFDPHLVCGEIDAKMDWDSMRQNIAWHYSTSSTPVYDLTAFLTNDDLPPLPSDQIPTMYPANISSAETDALTKWAISTLDKYIVDGAKDDRFPKFNCPKLRNADKYSRMTSNQKQLLIPHKITKFQQMQDDEETDDEDELSLLPTPEEESLFKSIEDDDEPLFTPDKPIRASEAFFAPTITESLAGIAYSDQIDNLNRLGCTMVELFSQSEVDSIRDDLIDYLNNTPELDNTHRAFIEHKPNEIAKKNQTINAEFSFSPGEPMSITSSFHNPTVINIRMLAEQKIADFLTQYINQMDNSRNIKVEQLIDQLELIPFDSVIKTGMTEYTKPSQLLGNDIMIGGWINLNRENCFQPFNYIRESHLRTDGKAAKNALTPATRFERPKYRSTFSVKPGSIVIFHQNLIFGEVEDKPLRWDSIRQNIGWRLTTANAALFDLNYFHDQNLPRLPSGERPRMYPTSFLTEQTKLLNDWAHTFKDYVKEGTYQGIIPREYCPRIPANEMYTYSNTSFSQLHMPHRIGQIAYEKPIVNDTTDEDEEMKEVTVKDEPTDDPMEEDQVDDYQEPMEEDERITRSLDYNESFTYSLEFNELRTEGCTVFEVLSDSQLNTIRKDWGAYLESVPEMKDSSFKEHTGDSEHINSNFSFGQHGTLNFASSFYADAAMRTREIADFKMQRFFKLYVNNLHLSNAKRGKYRLCQNMDRFALRPYGFKIKHEMIRYTKALEFGHDELINGWINLDSKDQTFYYVKDSHNDKDRTHDAERFMTEQTTLTVPSGYMVLFDNNLITGEVDQDPQRYDSMRQHVSWTIGISTQPVFPLTEFENQGLIRLPTGHLPRMFAKSDLSNRIDSLSEWAENELKDYVTDVIIMDDDRGIVLPQAHCPSLDSASEKYQLMPSDYALFTPRQPHSELLDDSWPYIGGSTIIKEETHVIPRRQNARFVDSGPSNSLGFQDSESINQFSVSPTKKKEVKRKRKT